MNSILRPSDKHVFVLVLLLYAFQCAATCPLPAPAGLKSLKNASCQFMVKWKAVNGAVNYNLQYKESSASNWIPINNIGNVTFYTIAGLIPATSYDVKVAAVCLSGEEGAYTTPITTTTVSCSKPENLTVGAISGTSADISWSVPCNETNFTLSYRKSGSSTWAKITGISSITYHLTGLDPETSYDVKVKSKCGNQSSVFSSIVNFTTLPVSAASQGKNVLLVIVDDSRFDTYTATGGPAFFADTNISRIASEGVSFELAFPVMSQCAPSRGSIITGLYPHLHGITTNPPTSISDTITQITFPQILQDNGYYTGLIGKYHISKHPQPGYNYWMEVHNNDYTNTKYNVNGVNKLIQGHQTNVIADSAIAFFHKVPEGTPFFLWYAYKAPHTPLDPRSEDAGLFDNDTMPLPSNFEKYTENYPGFIYNCHSSYDSTGITTFYRGYFELLNGVEETLGRIFNELENMGLMDSTLIIFMSDNGYLLGEHYMLEKQVAYEESIHIPIFMRYPPLIGAGKKVKKQIAANIDIAPTILDFAGIPDTFGMQGVSLLKLMNKEVTRKEMMYEFFNDECLPDIRAIRSLDYKYVQYHCSDTTEEFFDLTNDPHENINLVNDADYNTLLQIYRDKLTFWRNYYQDFTFDSLYTCSLTNPQRLTNQENQPLTLLNVFPNPSNNNVTVHLITSDNSTTVLSIMNAAGKMVYTESIVDPQTELLKTIQTEELPSGNYFVMVQHGTHMYQQLFVKQ